MKNKPKKFSVKLQQISATNYGLNAIMLNPNNYVFLKKTFNTTSGQASINPKHFHFKSKNEERKKNEKKNNFSNL